MTNSLSKKDNRPTIDDVMDSIGPIPSEAVFLGMADDGFPVMLSTFMSSANILIWNGEASFLKMVADFIMNYKGKGEMEFVVFTNNTEEWEFLAGETNFKKDTPCIGVIPFWSDLADQILLGLAGWVNQGIRPNHSIVVLIEGVENILKMPLESKQNFHYIFLRGKDRKVVAVGTAPKGVDLLGLQEMFHNVEYNQETDRYEFPEGAEKVTAWIPNTGE